jgi:hypothetical protein
MKKRSENLMLIAVRSGVCEDWGGTLNEITAGKTRISPRKLAERPQFGEFFERDFGDPRFVAERSEIRAGGPGTVGITN